MKITLFSYQSDKAFQTGDYYCEAVVGGNSTDLKALQKLSRDSILDVCRTIAGNETTPINIPED